MAAFSGMWASLAALTLTSCIVNVSALYFPMSNISVNIPLDKTRSPSQDVALATVVALSSIDSSEDSNITYELSGGGGLFVLDKDNGLLRFSDKFRTDSIKKQSTYQLVVTARDEVDESSANLTLSLTLLKPQSPPPSCVKAERDVCFWSTVQYSVMENRPSMTYLGTLGSEYLQRKLCPGYKVDYKVTEGSQYVSVIKQSVSSWALTTNRALERDRLVSSRPNNAVGSLLNVTVVCGISLNGSTRNTETLKLQVHVLDENDNAPIVQGDNKVRTAFIKNGRFEQGETLKLTKPILIRDYDSKDLNNYTVELLGDKEDLLGPLFNIFEMDVRKLTKETVLKITELMVKKTARITDFPYVVILRINDTSLSPVRGSNSVNITIEIYNNKTNDSQNPQSDDSYAVLVPSVRQGTLYPNLDVKVLHTAAPYARLTQALTDNAEWPLDKLVFRVKCENNTTDANTVIGSDVFNVTEMAGIVYVSNSTKLIKSPQKMTLTIEWQYENGTKQGQDTLTIHLIREKTESCVKKGGDPNDWGTCAKYKRWENCQSATACGLGSGGSAIVNHIHSIVESVDRCVWRVNQNNIPTEEYATCSPDLFTCPDKVCDPLEMLNEKICPQDCTTQKVLVGTLNPVTKRGIERGSGVCSCDLVGPCVCFDPGEDFISKNKAANSITARKLSNKPSSSGTSRCDSFCVLSVIFGSMSVLILIGAIFLLTWRSRCGGLARAGAKLRGDRKYQLAGLVGHGADIGRSTGAATAESVGSEYVRGVGLVQESALLPLNFDMNSALRSVAAKNAPDPKWEFPRTSLHLEQTLGEGEFGRVLRARAFEIAGLSGWTTVAVKTLKEDARDAELADLISEYELLKEVSHPNVIRLLGACTLPGGAIYLIIEFAEHGSLRNYLRRSRHVDLSEPPCTEAMLDGVPPRNTKARPACTITPRDILSFAWQISKGMAYLGDMKLVHRDLAARNVLLATGKLCKISDFGLTRDVYEDDAYLKRSKGRVPVKWMAPESLADHMYTSRSDIWSFGVLLWELVTLGASPYPGIAVQNLFHLLRSGYRMERPENCSPHLYQIMKKCWQLEPTERPSFRHLTEQFESMLEDGVEYLNLNPRIVHNRAYFTSLTSDDTSSTSGDTQDTRITYNNVLPNSESINLVTSKQQSPKCSENDKLPPWESPDLVIQSKNKYENDTSTCAGTPAAIVTDNLEDINTSNQYESPIKLRITSTPSNERPQSYIEMAGSSNYSEEEEILLPTTSININIDNNTETSTVTSI